jgi:hypothetical protein
MSSELGLFTYQSGGIGMILPAHLEHQVQEGEQLALAGQVEVEVFQTFPEVNLPLQWPAVYQISQAML